VRPSRRQLRKLTAFQKNALGSVGRRVSSTMTESPSPSPARASCRPGGQAAPSIAVIDEVPWLVEQDQEFAGALQPVWDRHLSAKLVQLVIGTMLDVEG
jgi:hypothetical protein